MSTSSDQLALWIVCASLLKLLGDFATPARQLRLLSKSLLTRLAQSAYGRSSSARGGNAVLMATLFTFRDGPQLNLWEECSLQSFADFGHELVLFSYSKLVPRGIRLVPAGDIISDKKFFDFIALAPQFAQFSDWFRYELLYRHGNWWVDTDILCSTPSLPDDDIFLGKFGDWLINGVIKFPSRHPLLADAVDHCESHWRAGATLRHPAGVCSGPS